MCETQGRAASRYQQKGATVKGPPAMGPSLQLSTGVCNRPYSRAPPGESFAMAE